MFRFPASDDEPVAVSQEDAIMNDGRADEPSRLLACDQFYSGHAPFESDEL